ncbi:uncharacterized protein LOC106169288 [Lingula anatina]|uniref:Uncharacterized protein LOC106169288 n=1 Tax=Lingula anatina TaxID=7574 RepID=A0A1S3J1L6_LINAN|nr:uncharacterized protein LOC106169288 [Lingula anatina]|eukprot:XP_013404153.1 uncharacterized protein LOC106169288 [Lingula anatina]
MKSISFFSLCLVLSVLYTQGAVTNSDYPLSTQSVMNDSSVDRLAAWAKAWIDVVSREAIKARMKDENLTAEVQDLHSSDNNFEIVLQDVKQKVNNGIQTHTSLQADNMALSGKMTALERQVQQLQTSLQQFANAVADVDRHQNILRDFHPECTGWSVTYQNKEYHFVNPVKGTTHATARACCHVMRKNLLAVNSAEEFNFIVANIPRGAYSGYWLDAECINSSCTWKNSPGSSFYNPVTFQVGGSLDDNWGKRCLVLPYQYKPNQGYVGLDCTTTTEYTGFICE